MEAFLDPPPPPKPKQLMVIDTDPGIDDSIALLTILGDPDVEVIGITCVRGNVLLPNAVNNALKIITAANKLEVPVYAGSPSGLVSSPHSDNWFGVDGLGDLGSYWEETIDVEKIPEARPEHAATFLANIVDNHPGEVKILTLGPLTNLALALHLNPQFLEKAKEVIIMGGNISGRGHIHPGVEFNFYMDADAAALVLEKAHASKVILTLAPLETCSEDLGKEWRWQTLGTIKNSVVSICNKLDSAVDRLHPKTTYTPEDSCAAMVAICELAVLRSQELYGFVENKAQRVSGSLICDFYNITKNHPNLKVITKLNKEAVKYRMQCNLKNFTVHHLKF